MRYCSSATEDCILCSDPWPPTDLEILRIYKHVFNEFQSNQVPAILTLKSCDVCRCCTARFFHKQAPVFFAGRIKLSLSMPRVVPTRAHHEAITLSSCAPTTQSSPRVSSDTCSRVRRIVGGPIAARLVSIYSVEGEDAKSVGSEPFQEGRRN